MGDIKGKVKLQVLDRAVLESPDAERVYRHAVDLDAILGQAEELYLQGRAYYVDANCQLEIAVYTGASYTARPYDQGQLVKVSYVDGSGTTLTNQDKAVYTAVGPMRLWTEGTLRADVEVVVKLVRTSGTGIRRVEPDLVASLTL